MFIAYFFGHNEGDESGILTSVGDEVNLVGMYECDGMIKIFSEIEEAEEWIAQKVGENA